MDFYLFNIGWPYDQAWWKRTRKMGIITTGFDNAVGRSKEKILTNLEEGDCVIASREPFRRFVGVGLVGPANTYRLLKKKELPIYYESTHKCIRDVELGLRHRKIPTTPCRSTS